MLALTSPQRKCTASSEDRLSVSQARHLRAVSRHGCQNEAFQEHELVFATSRLGLLHRSLKLLVQMFLAGFELGRSIKFC